MNDGRDVYSCFVVGPIGNKFAEIGSPGREAYEDALEVYEKVIMPACQAHGIEPVRADQIAASGEINEQIFRHLRDDDVVIADVSGGNPNVMYELGLRHTKSKLTIQIGEYGQLPFDIVAVRTIQFSRSDRGLIDARKALERALTVGLTEEPEMVTATRVWYQQSESSDLSSSASADPLHDSAPTEQGDEDLDEAGLLERIAQLEVVFPQLTESAEEISGTIEKLGAIAADESSRMVSGGSNTSASARLAMVGRFAKAIQPSADDLTAGTTYFAERMSAIDTEVEGILRHVQMHPESAGEEGIGGFLDSLTGTARTSREAMENMSQFDNAMAGLSDISRVLRRPAKQIQAAVRTMVGAMAIADSWESRAVKVRQAQAQQEKAV